MKKVLIVEDDKRIALALATRLRANNLQVLAAHDALGGVAAANRESPDLVILDLMMPAGGGLKVAERLRNIMKTATVPIIFLTAAKDPDLQEKAMSFAPHAFFEKPYDSAELMKAVHEALGVKA